MERRFVLVSVPVVHLPDEESDEDLPEATVDDDPVEEEDPDGAGEPQEEDPAMIRRKVRRKRRYDQRGGSLFRRNPRLVDQMAEGLAMVLGDPAPGWGTTGLFLGKQAWKKMRDHVRRRRSRR